MAIDPNDPIVQTAVAGKRMEDFLSNEGRFINDWLDTEILESVNELKSISPLRVFRIMQLQHRIEYASRFRGLIEGVILDGMKAMNIIEGED